MKPILILSVLSVLFCCLATDASAAPCPSGVCPIVERLVVERKVERTRTVLRHEVATPAPAPCTPEANEDAATARRHPLARTVVGVAVAVRNREHRPVARIVIGVGKVAVRVVPH